MNLDLREERMWDGMQKWHVGGLMGAAVFHEFTQPDMGDPHDHPWPFQSIILFGGYVEQVYNPLTGLSWPVHRKPGDSFHVEATHVHRITELPLGTCQTLILPAASPWRKSGFYQFRDDGVYHRFWDQEEWNRFEKC